MTTIGTDKIPGIQTDVDTADTVGISTDAPGDVCLVGPADLTNGTASANDVQVLRRPEDVREALGHEDDSMLTQQVFGALGEGAMPVYAVATAETAVTGEDLSALASTSGTLANGPVSENPADTVFTIDGSAKTTVITYEDPSTLNPAAGEVYLNPVTADFELDAAPGDATSNDTVDYTHFDYSAALDAASEQRGEELDFIAPVQEAPSVTDYALQTVKTMESFGDLAVAVCGLRHDVTIGSDMSTDVTWDSSRLHVAYPARNSDGESAVGSYAGRKATFGLDASAMGKSLNTQGRMLKRISVQDEIDLVKNNVVPIRSATGGARIVDDVTTVTDSNASEAGMRQGYARIVMDAVLDVVDVVEKPYIGRLNTQATRNAMETQLNASVKGLLQASAIEDYQLTVAERDAMSVKVTLTVDTTDPLSNIYNTVAAGQVQR